MSALARGLPAFMFDGSCLRSLPDVVAAVNGLTAACLRTGRHDDKGAVWSGSSGDSL